MKLNHDQASPRFLMFYQAVASFLKPSQDKSWNEIDSWLQELFFVPLVRQQSKQVNDHWKVKETNRNEEWW